LERKKLKNLYKLYIYFQKTCIQYEFFWRIILLIVDLGIFASNVFVFVFFYEKNIRDFLKRREKIVAHSFL